MTIKLPKRIQEQFEYMTNKDNFQGAKHKKISPRNLLNFIERNGDLPEFGNLYKYLFDSKGLEQNQLKLLNAFYDQDYVFEDEKFIYFSNDGRIIGFNENTKIFTMGFKGNSLGFNIKNKLTRDEILDSPFDINKLKEVPINEA